MSCISFSQSCERYLNYPLNLLRTTTKASRPVLEAYKQALNNSIVLLCVTDQRNAHVEVRDSPQHSSSATIVRTLKSERDLEVVLQTNPSETTVEGQIVNDSLPQCRFIYLSGRNSRARLQLTQPMLLRLFTAYQVMPSYLELLSAFGEQSDPRNSRFSAFYKQDFSRQASYPSTLLGDGGRHLGICYNLRSVAKKAVKGASGLEIEWSTRSAAILHQLDLEQGRALWIVTHGRKDLLERYDDLDRGGDSAMDDAQDVFGRRLRATLRTHRMFCSWATEGWTAYISSLEEVVVRKISMATEIPRDPDLMPIQYTPDDIQAMQIWKDKAGDVLLALRTNNSVMVALHTMYRDLGKSVGASLHGHVDDLECFAVDLQEMIDNTNMQIPRVQLLLDTLVDHRELLVQHLQGQAAYKTEKLSMHLHREAIVMRIIAFVTLFYLPATFVSTFFGTDVIKYQDENGGDPGPGRYSSAAMVTWCLFALPLTALTMAIAKITLHFAERALLPREERSVSRSIKDIGKDVWSSLQNVFSRTKEDDIGLLAYRPQTWSTIRTA